MTALGRYGLQLMKPMKMSGRTIGTMEHLRVMGLLNDVLDQNCVSPVDRQIAIELLTVSHISRMEDKWEFVADSIAKHIKQVYRSLTE